MKKIYNGIVLTLVALLTFLGLGCSANMIKIYGYKTAIQKYSWGEVEAKLLGSNSTVGKDSIQGAPYELIISLKSNYKCSGNVVISNINLLDMKNNTTSYETSKPIEKPLKLEDAESCEAIFIISNLDLDFVDYEFLLNFKLSSEELNIEEDVRLVIEKDYQERKTNDLWEKMLSV